MLLLAVSPLPCCSLCLPSLPPSPSSSPSLSLYLIALLPPPCLPPHPHPLLSLYLIALLPPPCLPPHPHPLLSLYLIALLPPLSCPFLSTPLFPPCLNPSLPPSLSPSFPSHLERSGWRNVVLHHGYQASMRTDKRPNLTPMVPLPSIAQRGTWAPGQMRPHGSPSPGKGKPHPALWRHRVS